MTLLVEIAVSATALLLIYCLLLFGMDWLLANRRRIGGCVLAVLGVGTATGVALVRIGLAYVVVRRHLREHGRAQ